ncbi:MULTISPECIES: hypothetical protein [Nostoc]|uniref:Uncharacterized protein n=1 Tax=Nostoc paludosum FACHB-159 TaxID=2692908 RepID=A0ABR8KEP3_9NOSO|nr:MULTISPECIES: hypothetical protein [Nostoc]MBD2681567.1 hypothetical protein [Nostoc sp. FACHB-857]MBD2738028.1 hypothetical protein [Nostoc paludosum FACHB-159]
MSSNREFYIKINDIIGKTWLASFDNSEGYILSFKLIEQNSSSAVSSEEEQEEATPTETNSQSIPVTKNYRNQPHWDENSPKLVYLRKNFINYFLKEKTQELRSFVETLNLYIVNLGIPPVEYDNLEIIKNEKKNKTIQGKIEGLIRKFDDQKQLSLLDEVFINFQNSNP